MGFNFTKFDGRNARLENRITITKSNSIGFPQKFYEDNKIKDYKYAVLFWDSENKAIGINFINDENEKSKFSVMHSKIGYGGSIVARSFFKTYNIDLDTHHGRYDWEKVNFNGKEIFVVKLDKSKFI
ncbi:MAG: hypothetical protein WC582_00915 [Patescibacteria group bacterium]